MRSTTCSWSSLWTMKRKIPDLWVKFPLFKPAFIWYNTGEHGRPCSPAVYTGLFYPHIWLYGMSDQYVVCRPPGCLSRLEVGSSEASWRQPTCRDGAGYNWVCMHRFFCVFPLAQWRIILYNSGVCQKYWAYLAYFLRGMKTNECIQRKESPPGDSLPGGLR